MHELSIVLVGVCVGLAFGALGAGPAFATPALAALGVPAIVAVASPLPALLPSALAGARQYGRSGHLDRTAALVAVAVGVPAAVLGALASGVIGGPALLVMSAVLLLLVGARMAVPVRANDPRTGAGSVTVRVRAPSGRRLAAVAGLVAGASFLSGLLANSGGSLLVPIFVLVLGLGATRAAGTAMLTIAVLLVPTLVVHWSLGHIDWSVAAAFACGVLPATLLGTRLGPRLDDAFARRLLGTLLIGFALVFAATRLV